MEWYLRAESATMDLPKTAPKRKEIDIYIDQKNQIEPTIKRIKNKIQERVILTISTEIIKKQNLSLVRKIRLISIALYSL